MCALSMPLAEQAESVLCVCDWNTLSSACSVILQSWNHPAPMIERVKAACSSNQSGIRGWTRPLYSQGRHGQQVPGLMDITIPRYERYCQNRRLEASIYSPTL